MPKPRRVRESQEPVWAVTETGVVVIVVVVGGPPPLPTTPVACVALVGGGGVWGGGGADHVQAASKSCQRMSLGTSVG